MVICLTQARTYGCIYVCPLIINATKCDLITTSEVQQGNDQITSSTAGEFWGRKKFDLPASAMGSKSSSKFAEGQIIINTKTKQ